MKRFSVPLLLLPFVATGCTEQQDQLLPFDVEPSAVTRTVPVGGGFVSSPAGASLEFPAGAFSGDQSVTLTPTAVPLALAASGRAISPHAFSIEASSALAAPARASLTFGSAGDSSWLATVVSAAPSGIAEHADTRVDVASGVASAPIRQLGTLAVVIPGAGAVFSLSGSPQAQTSGAPSPQAIQRLLAADSLQVRCGTPGDRCEGLSIRVSDNLLERVRRAAVVYPVLTGTLRLQNGQLVGSVTLAAGFRAELAGGRIAENVLIEESFPFQVTIAAGSLPAGNGPSASAAAGRGATLHIPESGNPIATVRHDVQIPNDSGEMEAATISITFPFDIHP